MLACKKKGAYLWDCRVYIFTCSTSNNTLFFVRFHLDFDLQFDLHLCIHLVFNLDSTDHAHSCKELYP